MHVADALVSPTVAAVAGIAAITLIGASSVKTKKISRPDIIPLMGVLGAFIFAAQMINFSIPGTGSSGHIIGGILLSAIIGPWAGFITLCSVLIIQCLIFADGGLMALGCNIINMGAMTCLVGYPLIYAPIAGKFKDNMKGRVRIVRIWIASIISCIVALEAGAFLVTLETELSHITSLPFKEFLILMSSIHLPIGLGEGIATAAVLSFIANYKPDMLYGNNDDIKDKTQSADNRRRTRVVIYSLLGVALFMAIGFTWLASSNPDGLEWSIEQITGTTEIGEDSIPSTAILPDYDSTFSGIVGGVIVMAVLWVVCVFLFRKHSK